MKKIDDKLDANERKAISIILKIAVEMVMYRISEDISAWGLSVDTPKKTKRKIVREAERWNEINRHRAIALKSAYDTLIKYFNNSKNNET